MLVRGSVVRVMFSKLSTNKEAGKENKEMQSEIRLLTTERDQFRSETKNLLNVKFKMEEEKRIAMEAFKKKTTDLER